MASTSPSHARFETDASPSFVIAPAITGSFALPPGMLCALVTLAGFALCMVGGGLKAGAFNMLPRDEGIFTSGVVAAWLAFGHGFKEWQALAISAPILALTCYAFFHDHHAPLALFGAEVAFVGAFGLILARWKASRSPARTL